MTGAMLLGAMVLAFAVALTAHVTIVFGLSRRPPRWRAALAAVLAPLAPYWAVRERMWLRAAAWVLGAVVYAGAWAMA